MRNTNIAEVLRACAATNSANEKVAILVQNDSEHLRYVLENAVSPYIVFNIKQVEFAEPLDHPSYEYNLSQLAFCIHHLRLRDVRGHTLSEFVLECSKHLNVDQQHVLRCVIEKDLRAGIGVKVVNKAFPGMIKDFSVQLCKEIDWDTVIYPCLVEVKRDGRRDIAIVIQGKVTHYSRNGKVNENYHCFDEELVKIADHQDVVFDGEVSGIVTGDNREERRLSQQQANRKTNVDMSKQVYTVWDWLPLGTWKSQSKSNKLNFRFDTLLHAFKQYRDATDVEDLRVRFTKWIYAKNRDEVIAFYEKAINLGCEGVVVKNLNSLYEFKRSSAWMKLKPEHTGDFKIVEVLEGKKSRKGTLGSIVVDVNGVKVHCGLGRGVSIADCKSLWRRRSKLIGMVAEITHGGLTLDGSLIVPKFIRIRDDK